MPDVNLTSEGISDILIAILQQTTYMKSRLDVKLHHEGSLSASMMVNPINLHPVKLYSASSEGICLTETLCSVGCNITGKCCFRCIFHSTSNT